MTNCCAKGKLRNVIKEQAILLKKHLELCYDFERNHVWIKDTPFGFRHTPNDLIDETERLFDEHDEVLPDLIGCECNLK